MPKLTKMQKKILNCCMHCCMQTAYKSSKFFLFALLANYFTSSSLLLNLFPVPLFLVWLR